MTDEQIIEALACGLLNDIGGCRKIDALSLIKRQKAEIEQWKEEANRYQKLWCEDVSTARAEAVKEFAEKLKEKSRMPLGTLYGKLVYLTDIDNLVKEMTEDDGK